MNSFAHSHLSRLLTVLLAWSCFLKSSDTIALDTILADYKITFEQVEYSSWAVKVVITDHKPPKAVLFEGFAPVDDCLSESTIGIRAGRLMNLIGDIHIQYVRKNVYSYSVRSRLWRDNLAEGTIELAPMKKPLVLGSGQLRVWSDASWNSCAPNMLNSAIELRYAD